MKIIFSFILANLFFLNQPSFYQNSYARENESDKTQKSQNQDKINFVESIKKEVGSIYLLNDTTITDVINLTIYADATITDETIKAEKSEKKELQEIQDLSIFVMGLHPKSCEISLRTLGNLNQYKNLIPQIIKESQYNENLKWFQLILDHLIMPFPMRLNVSVEYPRLVKDYPFSFPDGMFKGLQGQINIRPIQNRCLYFLTGKWKGEKKLLSSLLELMSETLSKLGLEILFRKST